jgi:amidase
MTVKESFDLAGHPTTLGLPALREHRAASDALAVDRLLAAGVNVFGKTNVPVRLADWQTFNPIYGTTNNPWDVTRTPGGSSGGSAAALAAGITALEIGSDIGASIRNPAHYCGVYGHKPTFGICAKRGHGLPGTIAHSDISVIGPLARSAEDLDAALSAIVGPDDIDGAAWRIELPAPRAARLRDFRVAVMLTDPVAEVDRSVQDAIAKVAEFLRREGARVSFDARPRIESRDVEEVYLLLLRAGTSGQVSEADLARFLEARSALPDSARDYPSWLIRGSTLLHRDWLRVNEQRHRMRLAWAEFFEDWDVLLCPTAATPAFAHNQQGERWERMVPVNGNGQPSTTQLFWAGYSGVAYLPSTVAPAGLSPDGLPVGVQIVGPQYGDRTTIALASWLEREYRSFVPPPGYA